MRSAYLTSLKAMVPAAVLLAAPLAATAQDGVFRMQPAQNAYGPAARTQAVVQSTARPAGGFMTSVPAAPSPAYGGGYGGSPYPYAEYLGPAGGQLRGTADVINAQGQFAISQQQAVLERENIKSARLDNKRKAMEQYLWERDNLPTLQDDRERTMSEELRRSRTNPPPTEIWSAKALNEVLAAIQKTERGSGMHGPSLPLDEEVVKHLNVTTGAGSGASTSMVRNSGRLSWPAALKRDRFAKDRDRVDQLMGEAFNQARGGSVDAGTTETISQSLDKMRSALKASIADYAPNDYMASVRFISQLQDSMRALQQPGGANYINGKWEAKGNTVGELVEQMSKQGLHFAPAASGDEAAYSALYQALLAYDVGLTRLVTR